MEVVNLCKNEVLNNINLKLSDSKKHAIIGKNGSGKSVLLMCLSAIMFPDYGSVYFNNKKYEFPLNKFKWNQFVNDVNKNICYVDKTDIFIEQLSIEENLEYYGTIGDFNIEYALIMLNKLNVLEPLTKIFSELSLGTKQKILLALAMSSRKTILILDEPTKGLDYDSKIVFYTELKQLNQNVIVTTHDLEWLHIFDKVYEFDGCYIREVSYD